MKLLYPAIFTPFDNGDGFTVEFPDLPGWLNDAPFLEYRSGMEGDLVINKGDAISIIPKKKED